MKIHCSLIACVVSLTSIFAQPQKADLELRALADELKAVGLAVVVVKKGAIVYSKNLGWQDVEKQIPLTTTSIFRIASISKSFSATGVMQLVEKKKLSLNDDVSKLIGFTVRNPNYPDKIITLRMLLSHTSSISDRNGYFSLDVINPAKNPNWAKCFNSYAPGSQYEYCNLNYNITGTIIERTSGERFDVYIREHIIKPLGLSAGHNIDSLDASRFATLYSYDSVGGFKPEPQAYPSRKEEIKNYVMGYSAPLFSPTGGVKISAADLARYMAMHMNYGSYWGKRIISRKSAKTMQALVAKDAGYGLAIATVDNLIPNVVLKGHTGSAYGLYSAMFFSPKKKFGFVVITNGCLPGIEDGTRPIHKKAVPLLYNNFIRF
ncbi:MAG: beta-lactamase family protein [Cyclobacteriaceae bacterium]|nr:beta-lactamase family protein [Cyclobacteriaceae bacterium]